MSKQIRIKKHRPASSKEILIIIYLLMYEGGYPHQLAKELGMEKRSVSRILKRLSKYGYLTIEPFLHNFQSTSYYSIRVIHRTSLIKRILDSTEHFVIQQKCEEACEKVLDYKHKEAKKKEIINQALKPLGLGLLNCLLNPFYGNKIPYKREEIVEYFKEDIYELLEEWERLEIISISSSNNTVTLTDRGIDFFFDVTERVASISRNAKETIITHLITLCVEKLLSFTKP